MGWFKNLFGSSPSAGPGGGGQHGSGDLANADDDLGLAEEDFYFEDEDLDLLDEEEPDEIVIAGDGTYEQEIVGESHYQDALERLAGGRSERGAHVEVRAELVLEDDNPYDGQAVAVMIGGEIVGHLDRGMARAVRAKLAAAGAPRDWPIHCAAVIVGGWSRDRGTNVGSFGVKLDFTG